MPATTKAKGSSIMHADEMLNELFRGRDRVSRDELMRAVESARLAPDVQVYFDDLPRKDSFTERDVIDEVNSRIRQRGRQDEIGLLG